MFGFEVVGRIVSGVTSSVRRFGIGGGFVTEAPNIRE